MKRFSDITERIEHLRSHLGLNKSRFSAEIGMKPQTYNNFIGAQGSKPNVELIVGIVRRFRVNSRWVLTGEGEMFANGHQPDAGFVYGENSPKALWVRESAGRMGVRDGDENRLANELRSELQSIEPVLQRVESQLRELEIQQLPTFDRVMGLLRRYFEIDPHGAVDEIKETLRRIEARSAKEDPPPEL